jgi:hypothetical protein
LFKEVPHVIRHRTRRPPPRPPQVQHSTLDRLWSLLTIEQQQQTLTMLSGIVLRQLEVPRDEDETEARDERP